MNTQRKNQAPKIIRKEDGTYLAKFEIEGTSKEELEEIFKRVEKENQELIAKVLNGRLVMGEYWNDEEEDYDV
ncbi:hypothetical protein NH288_08465 [Anaerococcus sp. NML200537]|uniref:hypothetical protein n=1 Tax=Anaerococcus sp. NML200537 TaxID=2954485 RepID=UPI002237EF2F|nr:hypothetical protein [Anaerococcus sp. NML200537]MCW6702120.1 hypothetical protein [Anaerococcus sp. NML200537]